MAPRFLMVTGSTGRIGARVASAFAPEFRVLGFDSVPPASIPSGADFIRCDFAQDEDVERAFEEAANLVKGGVIESVLHLAGPDDFSGIPSPAHLRVTVEGTRRLLRALRAFSVEQIVFVSSLLVMKPAEHDAPIDEESPAAPAWDYPRAKLEAEEILRAERASIPVLILRLAAVYDEDCGWIPLAQQIRRIREDTISSYFHPGDTSRGQPFVHLHDVVECLRLAVTLRGQLGPEETLLIAEPDLMTYAELQNDIGMLAHRQQWPTMRIPPVVAKAASWMKEKVAGSDEEGFRPWMIDLADAHYPVSIGRAHRVLGWRPRHRLRDTLPEMIARLKRDPVRWYRDNRLPGPVREPDIAE